MFGFNKDRGLRANTVAIDEWSGSIQKPSEKTFSHTDHEEWIWVDGYKGTDGNMKCRDHQFELDKQFDISDDQKVGLCKHGFHFCKDLKDVYCYYNLDDRHRFFKVRALVRKEDYDNYGNWQMFPRPEHIDKLVAKSIIFERELTVDEIVDVTEFKDEDADFKKEVRKYGFGWGREQLRIRKLVAVGYCDEMAEYIISRGADPIAIALAKQEGISWDTRINILIGCK